ncbi:hypothetical protein FV242_08295 [Methylobacterium sp. WL64]|uniref:hypothetical protein n=1 Tax=Methylobacterium sp. WL64 TaxID=2603894 RepID=UPI0011CB5690|nr:hypothetical protein [Methylobacterium sp. WL64]TXN04205.1 hypothetical protein FV242_08295 [Methylobacterium sp. WL64]
MKQARPLAYQGKPTTEPATTTRGHSVSYLASRIRRDRPDIAKRVEAGEFFSIRSAAIHAGIIKNRVQDLQPPQG